MLRASTKLGIRLLLLLLQHGTFLAWSALPRH